MGPIKLQKVTHLLAKFTLPHAVHLQKYMFREAAKRFCRSERGQPSYLLPCSIGTGTKEQKSIKATKDIFLMPTFLCTLRLASSVACAEKQWVPWRNPAAGENTMNSLWNPAGNQKCMNPHTVKPFPSTCIDTCTPRPHMSGKNWLEMETFQIVQTLAMWRRSATCQSAAWQYCREIKPNIPARLGISRQFHSCTPPWPQQS